MAGFSQSLENLHGILGQRNNCKNEIFCSSCKCSTVNVGVGEVKPAVKACRDLATLRRGGGGGSTPAAKKKKIENNLQIM